MQHVGTESFPVPTGPVGKRVRRMLKQADRAAQLGREDLADRLRMEAEALAAATIQYHHAIRIATEELGALIQEFELLRGYDAGGAEPPESPAADTTVSDLMNDLERAVARMTMLELSRP
ncbi:MAG: hypothetical protein ACRD1H_00540 [Vicinamibacterales bacterium]